MIFITILAPLKVALEKEPLSINGRKNRAQKMFLEYKPLLNISRAILDFKINREAQFKISDSMTIVQEQLLFKKHFQRLLFAAINRERLLFESDL